MEQEGPGRVRQLDQGTPLGVGEGARPRLPGRVEEQLPDVAEELILPHPARGLDDEAVLLVVGDLAPLDGLLPRPTTG